MSRDFDKAQEMVWASMEYVKVLGFRLRRTEGQRDDWKQVAQSHADELIKLRQHVDALKAERVAVIKDERDALRAECDDLRRVFLLVHGSLGIRQGQHIVNAIDALKKERDCANAERARHEAQSRSLVADVLRLTAEIERLKNPARQHPVAVGGWVECILTDACDQRHPLYRIGSKGRVGRIVERPNSIFEYHVTIGSDQVWWESSYCIPCDPPEATHDTPEGKQAAESVIQDCRKTDLLSWHCPRCKRTVSSRESMTFCPSCAGNLEGVPCVPATAVKTAPKPGDVSCIEIVKGDDK